MLKEDYELSHKDIQPLSNRDALAAFFAKLGYDTNERLAQNVAAMSFTGDNLKSAITHIERLASHDARMFEVYLFELKSVTVAITQGIVRAFSPHQLCHIRQWTCLLSRQSQKPLRLLPRQERPELRPRLRRSPPIQRTRRI